MADLWDEREIAADAAEAFGAIRSSVTSDEAPAAAAATPAAEAPAAATPSAEAPSLSSSSDDWTPSPASSSPAPARRESGESSAPAASSGDSESRSSGWSFPSISSWLSWGSPSTSDTPAASAPVTDAVRDSAPSAPPSAAPKGGSEYPMVNHPVAQKHFDGVRDGSVKPAFADQPEVLELSDRMGESREAYSKAHPEKSDKDAIHENQLKDAALQLDAGSSGKLDANQVLSVPAASLPHYIDSLTDPSKRPETLSQAASAAGAAAVGLAGIIINDPVKSSY